MVLMTNWSSIPGRNSIKFFPSVQHADWLLGPPNLLSSGNIEFFARGKWLGHEAYCSSVFSAKSDVWSYTSTFPYLS